MKEWSARRGHQTPSGSGGDREEELEEEVEV